MRVQLAYIAVASALLVFAGISPPPAHVGVAASIFVGLAVSIAAYAVVARRRAAPSARLLLPAIAGAAGEEIVWRWGALAGLAPLLGWGGALGVSTVGFAYRHTRTSDLVSYLALGAAFGGVFLLTGRLVAAVAAHAGYNALAVLVRR